MSRRVHFTAIAQLLGMAAATGAFDDYTPPAVVPADPEHPGPVPFEEGGEHCCWANWQISPTTHNADCRNAAPVDGAGREAE